MIAITPVLTNMGKGPMPVTRKFYIPLGLAAMLSLMSGAISAAYSLDNKAFSQPSKYMPQNKKMDFLLGKAMFKKIWVSAPASTQSSDGLGPLYNARSCLGCHPRNGRGRPPKKGETATSLFLQLSIAAKTKKQKALLSLGKADHIPDPVYGSQLQNRAVQGHDGEGQLHIEYQPVSVDMGGGEKVTLRKPLYRITGWKYGAPHKDLQISPRLAPQMIGLGLLEAISAQDIISHADPLDKDRNGISGKARKVWSTEKQKFMLGRFGWKASTPSVLEQSSKALHSDIGISNPIFRTHYGDCTKMQAKCQNAPHGNIGWGGKLEIGKPLNDRLAFYTANLDVPPQRNITADQAIQGKALFTSLGCANCHRPSFRTAEAGKNSASPHLSGKTIYPYSDLLLHDMGPGLADGRPVHNATGSEWRTAPLWGIGLSKAVNGNSFFLHDGRARSLTEAILWHGGEAQHARDDFAALGKQDRARLLAFVNSL